MSFETFNVVDGKFVPANWPLVERWDPEIPVQTIDGLEFPTFREKGVDVALMLRCKGEAT